MILCGGKQEKLFAEYMVKGMMNVYYVPKGERFFLENEEGKMVEYLFSDNQDTQRELIKPLFHVIGKSVAASEDVKLTRMSKADIIKLAHDYHSDVCTSNEDCIEFEYDEKNDNTIPKETA